MLRLPLCTDQGYGIYITTSSNFQKPEHFPIETRRLDIYHVNSSETIYCRRHMKKYRF